MNALKNTVLFRDIGISDPFLISLVASCAEVLEFKKFEYIFRQGDTGEYLLVVLKGDVNVKVQGRNKEDFDILLSDYSHGYMLREKSFFSSTHQHVGDIVVTSESLVAIKLSRRSIQNIFHESHPIWNTFQLRAEFICSIENAESMFKANTLAFKSNYRSTLMETVFQKIHN